jgi:undecaprenyl-diphosphatase
MLFIAILLGVIEGLTEFLPVSSTGHLIVFGEVLGFRGPPGKMFEISIQLGAVLAICWLYRSMLWNVATHLRHENSAQQFTLNLFLAFMPAAVLGLMLHSCITEYLFDPAVVAVTLILGGFAIMAVERYKPAPKVAAINAISPFNALLVGFFQSLAMIPGVSRSGATIMGALLLGVERKTATEFSFFLALPTMFAATFFDIFQHRHDLSTDGMLLIAAGFVTAFFSAMLCVKWLIGFVSHHDFVPFAWYRIAFGSLILAVLYL